MCASTRNICSEHHAHKVFAVAWYLHLQKCPPEVLVVTWCLQTQALPRGFGCHLVPAYESARPKFWLSLDACKQRHSPEVLVVTWCLCTKAPARGVYTPKEWSTPWNKFRTPAAMGHEMMPLPPNLHTQFVVPRLKHGLPVQCYSPALFLCLPGACGVL